MKNVYNWNWTYLKKNENKFSFILNFNCIHFFFQNYIFIKYAYSIFHDFNCKYHYIQINSIILTNFLNKRI